MKATMTRPCLNAKRLDDALRTVDYL